MVGAGADIWVYEWERDVLTRLITDPGTHANPVWTPDGRRIVFGSSPSNQGTLNLYWRRADGVGDAQRLTDSPYGHVAASWHPSGKFLAFAELNPETNFDLLILPIEGEEASGWKPGKPTVFSSSRFDERNPMFSPDGRWIAYQSNESFALAPAAPAPDGATQDHVTVIFNVLDELRRMVPGR